MNRDVRLCVTFLTHRKRKKLQCRLGAEGVLAFIDLLLSTAMSRPKGVLSGMDNEDIALDAQWAGNPDEFVNTLFDVGFLDQEDGVYRLHDWDNHNPFAAHADERSKRAKKAAEARWGKKDENAGSTKDAMPKNATSIQDASLSNAPSPTPSPTPTPIPSLNNEVRDFSRWFISHILKTKGPLAPKSKDLEHKSIDAIEKLIRLDGFSFAYIKEVLEWGLQDHFWANNVLSLSSLRTTKDGMSKFQRLGNAYETAHKKANAGNRNQTRSSKNARACSDFINRGEKAS